MWHQPIKPIHPPTNPQNYTLVCGFLSRGTPSVFFRSGHRAHNQMCWHCWLWWWEISPLFQAIYGMNPKVEAQSGSRNKSVRRSSRAALYLLLVHILWFRRSPIQCDTPYDTPATLEPQIAEGALALNHPYNDVGTNPMVGTPVVD